MNGWAERSTVRSVLHYRRQITDMGTAGTWLTSQAAYGVIVAVLDAAARRCLAPCCAQRLISSQNTRTFCTAASRATLFMASSTSLTRWYTRCWLIQGSWILDIFLTAKEGRLICVSTCTRVHTVPILLISSVLECKLNICLSYYVYYLELSCCYKQAWFRHIGLYSCYSQAAVSYRTKFFSAPEKVLFGQLLCNSRRNISIHYGRPM